MLVKEFDEFVITKSMHKMNLSCKRSKKKWIFGYKLTRKRLVCVQLQVVYATDSMKNL